MHSAMGFEVVYFGKAYFFRKKIMDSKESKNEQPQEEPVAASKVQTAEEHHATVIQHLNRGDTESAVAALMVDHTTGRQLSYGESRMMYG